MEINKLPWPAGPWHSIRQEHTVIFKSFQIHYLSSITAFFFCAWKQTCPFPSFLRIRVCLLIRFYSLIYFANCSSRAPSRTPSFIHIDCNRLPLCYMLSILPECLPHFYKSEACLPSGSTEDDKWLTFNWPGVCFKPLFHIFLPARTSRPHTLWYYCTHAYSS